MMARQTDTSGQEVRKWSIASPGGQDEPKKKKEAVKSGQLRPLQSVPSKRVLSCYRCRDVLRPARAAHPASSAAMAVTAAWSGSGTVRAAREVTTQKSTAHERGAAAAVRGQV